MEKTTYVQFLSLVKNMDYYNTEIEKMFKKEFDIVIEKTTKENLEEMEPDIQLACINGGIATNAWIRDCEQNLRALIEKIKDNPLKINTVIKEEINESESESISKSESESKSTTAESTIKSGSEDSIQTSF
jgi:L-2-hydroxyglutarate oxidase LhgO